MMTVDKAREIISLHETDWTAYCALVSDMMKELGGHMDCPFTYAKAYLIGHASRDPEVEKLQREIDQMTKMFPNWTFEKKQLEAELSAEREASRKLVELLKKAVGRHSLILDAELVCEFEEAVRLFATPGHSPEGRTL